MTEDVLCTEYIVLFQGKKLICAHKPLPTLPLLFTVGFSVRKYFLLCHEALYSQFGERCGIVSPHVLHLGNLLDLEQGVR